MRRNRHRSTLAAGYNGVGCAVTGTATRAENRIARFHRGALSDRVRRASLPAESKSLPGKHHPTTMRWPPVRDTPKGERRTRKHEARVMDLKSDHAGPGPQVTPKNSPNILQWCKRHTMGEFAPDGRYCLHPIVSRGRRPANGHHCQRSSSIAAERQGTTRKTRPAAQAGLPAINSRSTTFSCRHDGVPKSSANGSVVLLDDVRRNAPTRGHRDALRLSPFPDGLGVDRRRRGMPRRLGRLRAGPYATGR